MTSCRPTWLPVPWRIADKMDTAGIFGIGQHPKGDKDPFALRVVLRLRRCIIAEKNLNLDPQTLTEEAGASVRRQADQRERGG